MDKFYMEMKERLQPCIKKGNYTLSSGKKSDYYVDTKILTINNFYLHGFTLGEVFYDKIKKYEGIEVVVGVPCGGIPIVCAISNTFNTHWSKVQCSWVKDDKSHGESSVLAGSIQAGSKLVLIEDVVTTGQSILRAAQKVQNAGFIVLGAISLVDRNEGAKFLLSSQGIDYQSVFSISDLIEKS